MKVLFLPAWYPRPDDHMLGSFVLDHAEAVKAYAELAVLYISGSSKVHKISVSIADEKGVCTCRVLLPAAGTSLWSKLRFWLQYWLAFLRAYAQLEKHWGRADVSHVHVLTRAGLQAYYLKRLKKIPYLITEHWSRYLPQNQESYQGWWRRLFTRLVVQEAYALCPVSRLLQESMQACGLVHKRYQVIPNAVDMNRFSPASGRTQTSEKKIFLHVSCFDNKAKNIKGILHAVGRLSKERQDFELHLAGDGKDFENIKQYSESLGLKPPMLQFTGLLEGDAMPARYRQSHFLLQFSHYETFGIAVVEALACGLPVISSRTGIAAELLEPGSGFLVEPGDEEALLNTLRNCLNQNYSYQAEDLRALVNPRFTASAIGMHFAEIYRAAVQESSS